MTECRYGDPTCPCQDGDMCHYEGENSISVPPEYVRRALAAEADRAFKAAARACFDFAAQVRADIAEIKAIEGKDFDMNSYGAGYDNGSLNGAETVGKTVNRIAAYWPEDASEDDSNG